MLRGDRRPYLGIAHLIDPAPDGLKSPSGTLYAFGRTLERANTQLVPVHCDVAPGPDDGVHAFRWANVPRGPARSTWGLGPRDGVPVTQLPQPVAVLLGVGCKVEGLFRDRSVHYNLSLCS